jgi:hypothetical protein
MKLGMYIMPSEPISLCVCIYIPPIVGRQRSGKDVPAATNDTVEELLDEWICVSVYPLSLLGNNTVKTFPRLRIIIGGVVFYAVRVVSKESRLLVLPRTSCYLYCSIIIHILRRFIIILCRPFNDAGDCIASDDRWMINWIWFGRKRSWPSVGTISPFAWKDWGKLR